MNKTKEFVIYKITNTITGRCYIGMTGDYKKRMKEHFHSNYDNTYLHRSIQKYGKDKFKHEIVFECNSWEELCKEEIGYIKIFNTKVPNGYNLTDGGEGVIGLKRSKETRKKMSLAAKNRSTEAKRKISDAGKIFSTNQIIEIKQLLSNGISQHAIAKIFNVAQGTIGCIKRGKTYFNIKHQEEKLKNLRSDHKFSTNQIIEIKQLLSNGISQCLIAKQFNVVVSTISCIKRNKTYANIKLSGIDLNNLPKGSHKLSNDQILEIRKMLLNKISQYKIAKRFNTVQQTISRIKRNKTYTNIQLP